MPIFTLVYAWLMKRHPAMGTDFVWAGVIIDAVLILILFVGYLFTVDAITGIDTIRTVTETVVQ